jgi:hypothetical protein
MIDRQKLLKKSISSFLREDQEGSISPFYVQIFCTNVISAAFSSYVLALAKNSYEKRACQMLMKLTAGGVNFTNILRAAFTSADPKSAKI